MNGQGTDTVQLSHKDGFVFLHFERPIEWVKLDPPTANRVAEAMARAAYTSVSGDTPTTQAKSQITEQLRVRLKNRVSIMIRSAYSEAPIPSPEIQATRIVDECMKELV
jgi:hypothetical protein